MPLKPAGIVWVEPYGLRVQEGDMFGAAAAWRT